MRQVVGNSSKIFYLLCVAFVLALLLSACGGAASHAASPSPEHSATHSAQTTPTPSPTPAPTASAAESAKPTATAQGWMPGIPPYVPEFTLGQLDRGKSTIEQKTTGKLFRLYYHGVTEQSLATYPLELKSNGFQTASDVIGEEFVITASYKAGPKITTLLIVHSKVTGYTTYLLGIPLS